MTKRLEGKFIGFIFNGQDLSDSELIGDFTGAKFVRTILCRANLCRGTFAKADFTEAQLCGAEVDLARLGREGANLTGIKLTNCEKCPKEDGLARCEQ
jgi:uncharacterized protein YjbI with pentapeptide repeats